MRIRKSGGRKQVPRGFCVWLHARIWGNRTRALEGFFLTQLRALRRGVALVETPRCFPAF